MDSAEHKFGCKEKTIFAGSASRLFKYFSTDKDTFFEKYLKYVFQYFNRYSLKHSISSSVIN